MKTLENLKKEAKSIWLKSNRGQISLTREERIKMIEAYYMGVLPHDNDFSVAQWVEDGFPT